MPNRELAHGMNQSRTVAAPMNTHGRVKLETRTRRQAFEAEQKRDQVKAQWKAARCAILRAIVAESNVQDRKSNPVLAASMRREGVTLAIRWDVELDSIEGLDRDSDMTVADSA